MKLKIDSHWAFFNIKMVKTQNTQNQIHWSTYGRKEKNQNTKVNWREHKRTPPKIDVPEKLGKRNDPRPFSLYATTLWVVIKGYEQTGKRGLNASQAGFLGMFFLFFKVLWPQWLHLTGDSVEMWERRGRHAAKAHENGNIFSYGLSKGKSHCTWGTHINHYATPRIVIGMFLVKK